MSDEFSYVKRNGFVQRVSKNDRTVSYRLSDDSVDRANSRILPRGIQTENYMNNPVFLWAHDSGGGLFGGAPSVDSVIGRTLETKVTPLTRGDEDSAGFDILVEHAPPEISENADKAFKLVKGGFLNATSIGARVLEWEMRKARKKGPDITVFTAVEMVEASLVPIPANPNAIVLARSIAGDIELLHDLPSDKAEQILKWVHESRESHPNGSAHDSGHTVSSILGEVIKNDKIESDRVDEMCDYVKRAWNA